MSQDDLLSILSDGTFHSGESLGRALGVSRAAIWKQLRRLEALGLHVESIKGKGHRLECALELLDAQRIRKHLMPYSMELIGEVEVLGAVDSTNAVIARRSESRPAQGHVCVAEAQTAGRGRRGRQWISPFGRNIYLSIGWQFAGGVAVLEGLSLAVGTAIVDAVRTQGVSGLQLKWPNDVLHNDRKLAGTLIEMTGDAGGPCQVIVGVGINVDMRGAVAGDIDQPWTDVASLSNNNVSRNALVAELLNRLVPLLAAYEQKGFPAYRQQWQSLDAFMNQSVVLRTGDQLTLGVARGVDIRGALQLETTNGLLVVNGGEVSLRGAL